MRVRNLCSKMAAAGPQAPIAIFFTQKLPQGNFRVSPLPPSVPGKRECRLRAAFRATLSLRPITYFFEEHNR